MSFFSTPFGSLVKNSILSRFGIAIVAAVVGASSVLFMGTNDNPVEQAAETIIKDETGLDIDLTPDETSCIVKTAPKCVETSKLQQ